MPLLIKKVSLKTKRDKKRGRRGKCFLCYDDTVIQYELVLPDEVTLEYSDAISLAHEYGHLLISIVLNSLNYPIRSQLSCVSTHEILAWMIAREVSPNTFNKNIAIDCLVTHRRCFITPYQARHWLSRPLKLTKLGIFCVFNAIRSKMHE